MTHSVVIVVFSFNLYICSA